MGFFFVWRGRVAKLQLKKWSKEQRKKRKRVRVDWWLREFQPNFFFTLLWPSKFLKKRLEHHYYLIVLDRAGEMGERAGVVDSPWLKNDEDLNTPKYRTGQELIFATLVTGTVVLWVAGPQADSSAATRLLAGAPRALG